MKAFNKVVTQNFMDGTLKLVSFIPNQLYEQFPDAHLSAIGSFFLSYAFLGAGWHFQFTLNL